MIQLTVAIITYNEARNIQRCLESLQTVADEILVVDSYSTDGTQKIAGNFGATVIEHKFEGHIEQKNWAISQAKFPYVLSLDADEALDESLRNSILAVKNNWRAQGYTLNRLTNYCGTWIKHGNWYPDVKLRLWDSRLGQWAGQNPHDEYHLPKGAKIENLNGHLLHYSFYTFDEHLAQIKRFTNISSLAAYQKGKRSNWLKIIFSPTVKFLKGYVFRKGFLDGKAGWMIARWSAYATYLKYTKLLQHQKNKNIT
jgi:glycosyltransferase involved in cell wall biosynthesis